ncbi:MAG: outer membrane beta-barrel protein [Ferruginibacter sp.]
MQYLLRRKIIYLFIFICLLPLSAFTQYRELNLPDHGERNIHFGINLGANRSNYNFTRHPRFLQYDSVLAIESVNSTGINLAWMVNFRLTEYLSLRTYPLNLIFTEKAFQYSLKYPDKPADEDSITIKKVQGITLAFPLQLKFNSDRINNLRVFMMAGGRVEYDLAASAGKKGAEDIIKLNKLDYGVEAGIGFHFYFPVFVLTPEIKVGWGLANVHARDKDLKFSNTIDKINSRTLTFSLTVE